MSRKRSQQAFLPEAGAAGGAGESGHPDAGDAAFRGRARSRRDAASEGAAGASAAAAAAAAAAPAEQHGAPAAEESALAEEDEEDTDEGGDVDLLPPPPPPTEAPDTLPAAGGRTCRRCGLEGIVVGHSWQSCDATPITPPVISEGARGSFKAAHFSAEAHARARSHKQRSAEWLMARVYLLTASLLGAIFGLVMQSNARKVLVDKVAGAQGLYPPPNNMMVYGAEMEGNLLAALRRHLGGVELHEMPLLGSGCMAASPDGVLVLSGETGGLPPNGSSFARWVVSCVEAKCWCPKEYGGVRWTGPKSLNFTYVLQMILQAFMLESTFNVHVKDLLLVGLWRREMHVVRIPYSQELRNLCDIMRREVETFSHNDFVPAMHGLNVAERVRNLNLEVPADVTAQLQAAWDSRTIVFDSGVDETAGVRDMRVKLERLAELPKLPPSTSVLLNVLGVGAPAIAEAAAWNASLQASSSSAASGGGGSDFFPAGHAPPLPSHPLADPLASDLYALQLILALALHHDDILRAILGARYNSSVGSGAFVGVISRGSVALRALITGTPALAELQRLAAKYRTTDLNVVLVQNCAPGVLERALLAQKNVSINLVSASSDAERERILLTPVSVDFMRDGIKILAGIGKSEGVYLVESGEKRANINSKNTSAAAGAEGWVSYAVALAALLFSSGSFLPKVGRGNFTRALHGSHRDHPPVILYLEPLYITFGAAAGEFVRLLVRVALEALFTLLMAPVARLPGVCMAGEPRTDSSLGAGGKVTGDRMVIVKAAATRVMPDITCGIMRLMTNAAYNAFAAKVLQELNSSAGSASGSGGAAQQFDITFVTAGLIDWRRHIGETALRSARKALHTLVGDILASSATVADFRRFQGAALMEDIWSLFQQSAGLRSMAARYQEKHGVKDCEFKADILAYLACHK